MSQQLGSLLNRAEHLVSLLIEDSILHLFTSYFSIVHLVPSLTKRISFVGDILIQ